MIGTNQPSLFEEWKSQAVREPIRQKTLPGHTVYRSRPFNLEEGRGAWGLPLLSDFGQARIGPGEHEGTIQPTLYRAPEVILGMKWTSKVDIWNLGVLVCKSGLHFENISSSAYSQIWELFENYYMFEDRGPDGQYSEADLLGHMVALLGPPPSQFLKRSDKCLKYWDESGMSHQETRSRIILMLDADNWRGLGEIPDVSPLNEAELYLKGQNKDMFMHFVRKMVAWDPNDRQTARELLNDPWLSS